KKKHLSEYKKIDSLNIKTIFLPPISKVLNIVLLTMLDSGRNFIQDDKLIKQNFLKFNSCIVIFSSSALLFYT
ncbi:hypothetical protein ABNIH6_05237, partial [Acinetobacter baumannii ABNIH6]